MFSRIFDKLEQGLPANQEHLQRLFDLAITKKLGVVKLPPAFWMNDPKINPRSDHLLQAALLLNDQERCELAVSVMAVEAAEKPGHKPPLSRLIQETAEKLCLIIPEEKLQIQKLANTLSPILPEE